MKGEIIKFNSHGNDLYCDTGKCKCPSPLFIGTNIEHLMKQTINLTGYNDDHFFDEVNKEPRKFKCSKCKTGFSYQWKVDGVHITNRSKS